MKEANDVTILVCVAEERAEIENELALLKDNFGLKVERAGANEGQWFVFGSLSAPGFSGADKHKALDNALKIVGNQLEAGALSGRIQGYRLMGRHYRD